MGLNFVMLEFNNFLKSGTQVPGCLHYLLLLRSYSSKYWEVSSLLNFADSVGTIVYSVTWKLSETLL